MERVDTHRTVKNLMASGIPEKQAEAITIAINTPSNLATKEDIRRLEGEMKLLEKDVRHVEEKVDKLGDRVGWMFIVLIGIIIEIAVIGWYK
jgi:hypothetical protein